MTVSPTVAVAVHDGFYGCGTGAGYANFGTLGALADLLPADVQLAVLPLRLDRSSAEHHPQWHARARHRLRNATILPVDNGTDGQDRWGSLENFRRLVRSTADRLRALPAEPLLIIAFDAPFLGLGSALSPALLPHLVLAPRSSAAIHAPHDLERRAWERNGMLSAVAGGARIATISPFMAGHLHREYGIPRQAMTALPDGLTGDDWNGYGDSADPDLPPFVFSMGRAEPYKGFEDLLAAWDLLAREGTALPLLLIAATSEGSEPTPYQNVLRARAERLAAPVRMLTRFTPDVPRLLRHPGLRAVVVPSHAEPFGRIPMEAFAAGAAPVITTTSQGLGGQIRDGVTGFRCEPKSPRSLALAVRRALEMSPDQRSRMRDQARRAALRDYDHPAALRTFLTRAAPWLRLRGPDHRIRLPSTAPPAADPEEVRVHRASG
ncbi:glycosyltransferase family 4 protein [Amycolatopsis rubida]|uniref:Glycosyltransferase family 4 protein n=1 Tax=Amycolatopsis rubida TaxID=112413 RepID=A0A1I5PPJ2_9PSEU|nr:MULTISPECIES: glycosyltransferase family 4 protein [Amycolatopsis]MYW92611.1 glycosyltransferase [Amycolatopsis rubida]NEC57596.1 glycosyltransferase family 4 protein [Amycolatopsis rubida]OAP26249.1 Glycogen synthase [Amycolatopsis sp. M39]SFP35720.1 Glycosyltransferase involved in cell wall bisynthesis [Amycolatopsis rubida]